jgi:hypothetical protein
MNSKSLYALFFGLLFAFNVFSEEIEVLSPNKIAKFKVNIGKIVCYSVF